MPELESLLQRLIQQEVKFVIVGGFAAVAYGVTLLTQDLDVCCPISEANLKNLHAAVQNLNPVHRLVPGRPPFILSQLDLSALKNLYLDTNAGPLDCLSFVKGIGEFPDVERESVGLDLPIGRCRVLSLDALIRAKEAMGTPKDKLTILQLRAIRERGASRGP